MVAMEEPMRAIAILAALMLVGCGMHERHAQQARGICQANGNPLGSAEFNRCFERTFASLNEVLTPRRGN
jgi:hypothetical protein